jgi:hypothetical protein
MTVPHAIILALGRQRQKDYKFEALSKKKKKKKKVEEILR